MLGGEGGITGRQQAVPQDSRPVDRTLHELCAKMHGERPSLKDITLILEEIPEIVDLHCDEQFDNSEEDTNYQLTEPAVQAYGVVTTCCKCYSTVRLVVECGAADIRHLEQLFLNTLTIVCPRCA